MVLVRLSLVLGLVVGLAGCGGDDDVAGGAATSGADVSTGQSPAGGATGGASPAGGADAKVLTAVVGEKADPDAFTLTLQDSSGAAVTSLPAGQYEVRVSDLSAIHNFVLKGAGVDEATSVPEIGDVTWTVQLQPGAYTAVCGPHPKKMQAAITVT